VQKIKNSTPARAGLILEAGIACSGFYFGPNLGSVDPGGFMFVFQDDTAVSFVLETDTHWVKRFLSGWYW
jgi:hypothetical protein